MFDGLNLANVIITYTFIAVVLAFLLYVLIQLRIKYFFYILYSVFSVIAILSFTFGNYFAFDLSFISMAVFIVVTLILNSDKMKKIVKHPFKSTKYVEQNKGVEKIFDKVEFYDVIEKTIIKFSTDQTGALLTFEKDDSLNDYIKANGVIVKAPVTQEILETIFYEGTRLHDGAVIIKDNIIEAAAVMYPNDRNAYGQKYGARHRAAMGISKVTDSVTVVVSEETGRISIATEGELQTVTQENFRKVFENYMR